MEEASVSNSTYSITKDFDWSDTENNRLLFEMTANMERHIFKLY